MSDSAHVPIARRPNAQRMHSPLPPPPPGGGAATSANRSAATGLFRTLPREAAPLAGAGAATLRRKRTLFRPDRAPARTDGDPHNPRMIGHVDPTVMTPWVRFSRIASCCFPASCLASSCKIHGAGPQQAWREKWALCVIIFALSTFAVVFTLGLGPILCPDSLKKRSVPVNLFGSVIIRGEMYNKTSAPGPWGTLFESTPGGFDATTSFAQPAELAIVCDGLNFAATKLIFPCENDGGCLDSTDIENRYGLTKVTKFDGKKVDSKPAYEWPKIREREDLFVIDDTVLNMRPYLDQHPKTIKGDIVDAAIREAMRTNDGTKVFIRKSELWKTVPCLLKKYGAGKADKSAPSCIFTQIILIISLVVVMGLVLTRFIMAILFAWFISPRLARDPDYKRVANPYKGVTVPVPFLRRSMDESTLFSASTPQGSASISASASSVSPQMQQMGSPMTPTASMSPSGVGSVGNVPFPTPSSDLRRMSVSSASTRVAVPVNLNRDSDLFTVLLVTCYSEGDASIRTTIDSLASTDYDDQKKLLFVVADGLITGKGNAKSTPDLIIDMMELDETFHPRDNPLPQPFSYVAVASGAKQHNMAKVYVGQYVVNDHRVPMVAVIKCGTPEEQGLPKPGNRGKRDSQLILMHFFSRVMLNDRMTPLDFELFRKVHHVTGVTPDLFEVVLMVDADTKVMESSLHLMINALHNDPSVMGLCGETKIANKKQSWVTMIQVFEYYISHHLGKSFESVFGGVTCLPGCFCMYRLKARKDDGKWVPIVVNPDVVEEYSSNEVETLHQKNLLLLGEDRFLSTLMLRTFPKRKMIFVPKALCKTVVPDDFATLLSQRRRWINSTIHNLLELALVRELCGIFCFSMQFVVFLELIGTAILPVGLLMLYYLLINSVVNLATADDLSDWRVFLPLTMMLFVLILPAFLVLLTSRKISYVGWMGVYMLGLPVWNLILPLYAFWHFDDFSWGATRQVAGEAKDTGHGSSEGTFDSSKVSFKKWEDYEKMWRNSLMEAHKQLSSRLFGTSPTPDSYSVVSTDVSSMTAMYAPSPSSAGSNLVVQGVPDQRRLSSATLVASPQMSPQSFPQAPARRVPGARSPHI